MNETTITPEQALQNIEGMRQLCKSPDISGAQHDLIRLSVQVLYNVIQEYKTLKNQPPPKKEDNTNGVAQSG